MDVLTTRTLNYVDKNGASGEILLTVFSPVQVAVGDWRGGFEFGPPIAWKFVPSAGVDFIQALVGSLIVARGYAEGSDLAGRIYWQGMSDCGLPWRAESASPPAMLVLPQPIERAGELDVLATRKLGFPDENGAQGEALLTVFRPVEAKAEGWRCFVSFEASPDALVYCGTGVDAIESILDGLSTARAIFEARVPAGWVNPPGELLDCRFLPYKIGRSFWTEPPGDVQDMPDFD